MSLNVRRPALLDPHLTDELNGTKLKYWLRDQYYDINLSQNDYTVIVNSFSVNSGKKFSVDSKGNRLTWYNQDSTVPALVITRDKLSDVVVKILKWGDGNDEVKKWTVESRSGKTSVDFEICSLKPNTGYSISAKGKNLLPVKSDNNGQIRFTFNSEPGKKDYFELIFPGDPDIF